MKKLLYIIILPGIILISCDKNHGYPEKSDSVFMDSDRASDIYYSLTDGQAGSYTRADWDIAFSVPLQTATILINEGAGVKLYSFGDTTQWDLVDTAGIAGWAPVYNDKADWMNGAFNRYSSGGFNYGWGTYDHGNTYDVWGDSIYIIRLTNGDYKKLFVRKRLGHTDTYELRWANVDGSNQIDASFSPVAFESKHFIQYSIVNQEVVEAQPDKDAWDLLFTKYIVKIPIGLDVYMDYNVVGVLMNQGLQAVEVTGIDPAQANYTNATNDFSTAADGIGWEWKVNDPVTHAISLADSTSYFVKVSDTEIYRIYFTLYDSNDNGNISFKVKRVE
jgi:hypothetical protein